MDSTLVIEAAIRLGVHQERIFGLAFDYCERRCSRSRIVNAYNDWYWNGIICPEVEDFIIDVLSGRVQRQEVSK